MSEKKYTKDHEWIKIENKIGTVGITNNAQEQLGDIVFFELPELNKKVKRYISNLIKLKNINYKEIALTDKKQSL